MKLLTSIFICVVVFYAFLVDSHSWGRYLFAHMYVLCVLNTPLLMGKNEAAQKILAEKIIEIIRRAKAPTYNVYKLFQLVSLQFFFFHDKLKAPAFFFITVTLYCH